MKGAQIYSHCISYTNGNDCIQMQQKTGCNAACFFCCSRRIPKSGILSCMSEGGIMGLCIIGSRDLDDYRRRRGAILIDLRDQEEYRRFHINGAVNVPAERLEQYMNGASKKQNFIFCCQHGSLSLQEGKRYVREGYQICSLAGGVLAYRQTFRG